MFGNVFITPALKLRPRLQCSSMAELLPSVWEALGLIPGTFVTMEVLRKEVKKVSHQKCSHCLQRNKVITICVCTLTHIHICVCVKYVALI